METKEKKAKNNVYSKKEKTNKKKFKLHRVIHERKQNK